MVALQAGAGMKLLGGGTVKGPMCPTLTTFAETTRLARFRTLWA